MSDQPTCRGSYALGTACGHCERCQREMDETRAVEPALEPPEHILQFFAYEHLPAKLQFVSIPFYRLAHQLVERVPRNPERTVALRKLLEAKDATVRASIAKP